MFLNSSAILAQTNDKAITNTSQVLVTKTDSEEKITINFNVNSPVENALIIIRNEKGDLVFMENRMRFQGAYTRTISLKEVTGKNFEVQIKNDSEHINRVISMR